jgi:hypothetical protein
VESENVVSDVEIRGAMDRAAMNAFLNEPVLARIATVRGTGRMWCRCGSTGTAKASGWRRGLASRSRRTSRRIHIEP